MKEKGAVFQGKEIGLEGIEKVATERKATPGI